MRRLRPLNIAHYGPMIEQRKRSPQGRIRKSYVPLFTGYVFVRGDEVARHDAVSTGCISRCLTIVLPRLSSPPRPGKRLRWQIALFGFGQFAACIGLFWAGGYGAPRKVAAGAYRLLDSAAAGMYLNGIGALVAVIGGIMFVLTVLATFRTKAAPAR